MNTPKSPRPAYRIFAMAVAVAQFFVLLIGGIEAGALLGIPENLRTGASLLFALLCLLTPHYPAMASQKPPQGASAKSLLAALVFCLVSSAQAGAAERVIYTGEPFAEALYDLLAAGAPPVSHEAVQASSSRRTDVFRLRDGRFLIIQSEAAKTGEPYSITKIKVTGPDGRGEKIAGQFALPQPPAHGR